LRMVGEIDRYGHPPSKARHRQLETIYIGWNWKHPQGEWIKLNCDVAYKESMDVAGCGGLFRDLNGRWLKGYPQKIGACDTLQAKMWGMYTGMQMARIQ
ncbi:non-LTR retroelement reverse transcriptase, partial [Trifolium medium]|nr:non-LTR retroelement reverse transcriptase [Trifolium medium]